MMRIITGSPSKWELSNGSMQDYEGTVLIIFASYIPAKAAMEPWHCQCAKAGKSFEYIMELATFAQHI
jgi:hypothetical protein